MKSKKRILISVSAVFVFLFIVFAVVVFVEPIRNEIIFFVHLQKENIGEYEKAVFESCRSGKPKFFTAEKDGVTYTIPLPDGATEFANEDYPGHDDCIQFLAINYETYMKYFDVLESLPEYEFEEFGAMKTLKSKDGNIVFSILMSNYARRYELLNVSYY
ncbi:MAG: hypothetical protein FWF05_05535 [Oscillospiraceae bacterium]|nr:hypothetical protein [Oscillospiraceae bacterium]